jgi:hypothetical protein
MWTLHYTEEGTLKAKEFSDKQQALDYALENEPIGKIEVHELISPNKTVVMNKEAMTTYYVENLENRKTL